MAISSFSFQVSISAVNSWMWIYLHIFLLLWTSCYNTSVTCNGGSQVIGSSLSVLAIVGDDVILPCHIEPSVNVAKGTVEWTRPDLKPEYVHMLQHGIVQPDVLNPLYQQRTSLFHEKLLLGNISLKLSRVQLSDEGKFKCFVPTLRSRSLIQLLVGNVSQPVISLTGSKDDDLSLTCDSGCWFPQPEVSWLDSEGNNLSAESLVTDRPSPSHHCYAVQSNVTVRGTGHVTCRVHLPHFNHTVETAYVYDIKVKERGLPAGGKAGIVITVIIIILLASILGYFYWKNQKQTGKENTDLEGMPLNAVSPGLLKEVKEHEEQYDLNSKPTGLCLIIINENFKDDEDVQLCGFKDADSVINEVEDPQEVYDDVDTDPDRLASRPEEAALTQKDTGDTSSLSYDDIDEEVSFIHDSQPRSISPKPAAKSGDTEKVGRLFNRRGFRVLMCENQTGRQMKKTLECISSLKNITELQELNVQECFDKDNAFTDLHVKKPLQHTDAFVCYIHSKGAKGGVKGTDGEILSIEDITTPFNVENCPDLENKPKVFLLEVSLKEEDLPEEHSMEEDFLVAIANKEGYDTYYGGYGGFFTRSVCTQMGKGHDRGDEIQIILNNVIKEVSQRWTEEDDVEPQIPDVINTLKKNLLFRKRLNVPTHS